MPLNRFTHGEEKGDPVGVEPAGHEPEDVGGLPVEPLRVVDDAEERRLGGGIRKQGQRRQAHLEAVRRSTGDESEGGGERVMLRSRQPFEA